MSRTHSLEEQLALYDAQCRAQSQETRAIKEALSEAVMELEVWLPGIWSLEGDTHTHTHTHTHIYTHTHTH